MYLCNIEYKPLFKRLILLFFLSANTALGQFSPDFSTNSDWKDIFMPKVHPFMLFHPNTPGLAVGLEIRPLRSLSVQAEYTLPFYGLTFYNNNFGKFDQQFQRVRAEIRFYPDPNEDWEYYFAAEGIYNQEKYFRERSFIIRDELAFNYIRSDITLNSLGGTLKAGYQFVIFDWFIVDTYVGAGAKAVTTTHAPIGLYEVPLTRETTREGGDQFEGTKIKPHFSIGARLGFSFFPRY